MGSLHRSMCCVGYDLDDWPLTGSFWHPQRRGQSSRAVMRSGHLYCPTQELPIPPPFEVYLMHFDNRGISHPVQGPPQLHNMHKCQPVSDKSLGGAHTSSHEPSIQCPLLARGGFHSSCWQVEAVFPCTFTILWPPETLSTARDPTFSPSSTCPMSTRPEEAQFYRGCTHDQPLALAEAR